MKEIKNWTFTIVAFAARVVREDAYAVQVPQNSNQTEQISDQYPQESNQTPQESNQSPQVSDQVTQAPQISDQYPQESNQTAQVSDQVAQESNQVPQESNQVPQQSNQTPQNSNQTTIEYWASCKELKIIAEYCMKVLPSAICEINDSNKLFFIKNQGVFLLLKLKIDNQLHLTDKALWTQFVDQYLLMRKFRDSEIVTMVIILTVIKVERLSEKSIIITNAELSNHHVQVWLRVLSLEFLLSWVISE